MYINVVCGMKEEIQTAEGKHMHSNVVQLPEPIVVLRCEKKVRWLCVCIVKAGYSSKQHRKKKKKIRALGKLVLSVGRILVLHHVG